MCYSKEISFLASLVLFVIGIYCINQVLLKKTKQYLLFAFTPVIFGIQQFCEGLVWVGFENGHVEKYIIFSTIYLIFAVHLWPWYIPLTFRAIEENKKSKRFLSYLTIIGCIHSIGNLILHYELLFSNKRNIVLINQSIHHGYMSFNNTLALTFLGVYIIVISLTGMISTASMRIRFLPILIFLLSLMVFFIDILILISLWCFHSAITSIFIMVSIHKLTNHSNVNHST